MGKNPDKKRGIDPIILAGALLTAVGGAGLHSKINEPRVEQARRITDQTQESVRNAVERGATATTVVPIPVGADTSNPEDQEKPVESALQGNYKAAKHIVDTYAAEEEKWYREYKATNPPVETSQIDAAQFQEDLLKKLGLSQDEFIYLKNAVGARDNFEIATVGLEEHINAKKGDDDFGPEPTLPDGTPMNDRDLETSIHFGKVLSALVAYGEETSGNPYNDAIFLKLLNVDAEGLRQMAQDVKEYYYNGSASEVINRQLAARLSQLYGLD